MGEANMRHSRSDGIFSTLDQIVGNSRGDQEIGRETNGKARDKHPLDILMERCP
jgi:hypothetical protein